MLRVGLAIRALLRAIKGALSGKMAAEPTEHLPPGHPDGEPRVLFPHGDDTMKRIFKRK